MVEYRNAVTYSLEELASGMTHCFEDYVIPVAVTPTSFASMIRVDAIDLASTILAVGGSEIIGMLLVGRRGSTMRIAAMAVAKAHRSLGLGGDLIRMGLTQSKERGERHVVLEVIECNVKARAFYDRNGFQVEHRLISGTCTLESSAGLQQIKEIPLSEMAARPFFSEPGAAAWQMSSASVCQMANPVVAYDFDGFAAAVVPKDDDRIVCLSLAPSGMDDACKFRGLLSALGERYPGHVFQAMPCFPEPAFQELFQSVGLESMGISQFQMSRELGPDC